MKTNYKLQPLMSTLAAARRQKRLSQADAGKKSGVGQAHWSRIESGSIDVRLSSMIDITRALGLELMLVPKEYVPAVKALIHQGAEADEFEEDQAAYSIEEDEEDSKEVQ